MWNALRLKHPLFSRETLASAANLLALYVGVYLVYLTAASICLSIHATNTFAAMLWAPVALALVALTMYGYRFAPPVALGAYVLKTYVDFKPPRLRLRDNTGLILVAVLVSSVTATVGVGSLWLGGVVTSAMTGATWMTWWLGDMLGILVFAPLLFKWLFWPTRERTRLEYLEMWAVMAAVAGVAFLVFWRADSEFSYYLL